MDQGRAAADPTRKALKAFGVAVTDFDERARGLVARGLAASTEQEREAILAEAARLTADLHRALQSVQQHVYQLQSDFLMELVVRQGAGLPPLG
jgi:hypothetical protein